MLIAVCVGLISGIIGILCWALVQVIFNLPGVYNQVGSNWFLVPPAIGAFAAAGAWGLRSAYYQHRFEWRKSLADLFHSYHYGIFILRPIHWVWRGMISLFNAFLGGTFGLEGGMVELNFAALPFFSRHIRLFIEEKQLFIICTMSASFGVALGAPFSGALIALEMTQAVEARVRAGAVVAALTSYGTATFLQAGVLSRFFTESSVEKFTLMGSLFDGMRPLMFDFSQWFMLSLGAICVGLASTLAMNVHTKVLSRTNNLFEKVFGNENVHLAMLVTGLMMGIAIWLVPESFSEPWRLWEDVAWLRLSSPGAVGILIAEWALLVIAFSGWGSAGLFSPTMLLGALLGYALGNTIGSSWALPLAIAGAASCLAVAFRIPIAAAAIVLEIGHDGSVWWLAILSVASASILARSLRVQPLHELLLEKSGLRIIGGRAASVLASLKTSEAMYKNVRVVRENATLQELRDATAFSTHNFIGIVSSDDRYLGLLALEQLPPKIRAALKPNAQPTDLLAVERVVEIRDLMDTTSPTLKPDDSLEKALELLQDAPCVAVVDEGWKLCGLIFESSITGRYKREIASNIIRNT